MPREKKGVSPGRMEKRKEEVYLTQAIGVPVDSRVEREREEERRKWGKVLRLVFRPASRISGGRRRSQRASVVKGLQTREAESKKRVFV